ncbi:glycosyltransferase family 1 protein [Geodermatophilus sabuli]|uniref:Glycosyltransferase family 1 protein n=1 Tax=Geodermatophilus sabuli TaxID=1564158 RepID=A0A7K3W780_9ACTN|nr:glycosyltransferase [Geodermatophilus sabuli]NEK60243.1 glycosyltransferase family 1 protein [Geodermatophilus sabuli]
MSRILFTTMPMAGHLRPGLPMARQLADAGHEVAWYSGAKYAALSERAGARVFPMGADLDFDDAEMDTRANRSGRKPGLQTLKWAILEVFIGPIPGWVAELDAVIDEFRPDVVVAEQGFMAGPIAAERRGIPSVVFSVSPLGLSSVDTAPFGTGLLPSSSPLGRLRNRSLNWMLRSVVFAECQRAAEQVRIRLGLPPLPGYFMDWGAQIADRYLCPSVPEFEYPRRDLPATVEFVGPMLPAGIDAFDPPAWWDDVLAARAAGRPVVLVTQGTLATDPHNLVLPAVEGLAGSDALVVATAIGYDADAVLPADDRPANLRLTPFIPFDRLLPLVDVMVTNGGYGGVQMALAHGVPLVVAGLTEDKAEVSARVTWAGAGVALRTDTPSPEQVRDGVTAVLDGPRYRERARELEAAYARHDGAARAAEVVLEVAASRRTVG